MARTQAFHVLRRQSGLVALLGAVLLSLAAAAAANVIPANASNGTHDREIVLKAQRFSYSPGRVSVNRGDRLDPQDVSHGLYLDGYGSKHMRCRPTREFSSSPPTSRECTDSAVQSRPLHPFMVGELNVESGTPHTNLIFLGGSGVRHADRRRQRGVCLETRGGQRWQCSLKRERQVRRAALTCYESR